MAPFYGWGLSASRLEPFQGGSLLFTTKFPEIPDTYFIDLRRMKGHPLVLNMGPLDWESSTLTTRPLLRNIKETKQNSTLKKHLNLTLNLTLSLTLNLTLKKQNKIHQISCTIKIV